MKYLKKYTYLKESIDFDNDWEEVQEEESDDADYIKDHSKKLYDFLVNNGVLDKFIYNVNNGHVHKSVKDFANRWGKNIDINMAFVWEDSPEGEDFWCNLDDRFYEERYESNESFEFEEDFEESQPEGIITSYRDLDKYKIFFETDKEASDIVKKLTKLGERILGYGDILTGKGTTYDGKRWNMIIKNRSSWTRARYVGDHKMDKYFDISYRDFMNLKLK